VQSGYVKLVLVELKKNNLDRILTGADIDASKKLMRINTSGELENTVKWSEGAYGTLDRNLVYPLTACRPGEWKLDFITNTEYIISGPGVEGLRCDKRYGRVGRFSGAENDMGFAWDLVKDLNFVFIPVIDTDKLVILNISDQTAPVKESSIEFANFSVYASAAKSTNYVYVAYVDMDNGFYGALKCFHVADKANPVLIDTKTAGLEGVPEDFFCYTCKISGSYLYVQGYNYIYIFDISDPFDISYVTKIGGNGSPNYMQGLWDFAISGQYLFTVSYIDNRFVIIDISDPHDPGLVTTLSLEQGGNNVDIAGNYAFVKTKDGKIITINISNVNTPFIENTFGGPCAPYYTGGYGLQVDGDFLYSVNQNDHALSIIDMTDPVNLNFVEAIIGQGEPHYLKDATEIVVYNGYAYITADDGLTIYRLSTTVTNKQGGDQLRILPAAWGDHTYTGESVSFVTAMSWENENPVQILYDLLTNFSKLPEKLIACSGFFGDKIIGSLYADLEQYDTIIKIAVTINELIIRHGYDYENNRYLNEQIYEGQGGVNKSFLRHQFKRTAGLYFPGIYPQSQALLIPANKYNLWQNGVKLVAFEVNLQGVVLTIGDKVRLVSEHPVIDQDFEIIGRTVTFKDGLELKFVGYNVSNIWE